MKIGSIVTGLILAIISTIPAETSLADSSHFVAAVDSTIKAPSKVSKKLPSRADSLHAARDSAAKREKTVVVHGKSGQALAQSKQQNADNLKNVISAELIAKLPDQTTADALQRVPGVSVERDHGEGTYVMIRGTEPRLSTVTVDGQSIAGTDASTRAIGLNVIPSDQLAEIEVAKVLMPEMDANAIGGTVNLITNTAKDSVTRIKLNFTPGYMQMSGKPIWQGSASGGRRFFDNALGIFIGGSYDHEQRETQGIAMTYDTDVVVNDHDTTKSHSFGQHLWSLMLRDYQYDDERAAGNTKIDYRFSPEAKIYLAASTNFFGEQEERRSLLFDAHNGDAMTTGADPGAGANLVKDLPITRSIKDAYTGKSISSITLGGNAPLFGLKADGSISYSYGETNQPNQLTGEFQNQNTTILFNPSNLNDPQFTPINLSTYQLNQLLYNKEVFQVDSSFYNPANYKPSSFEIKTKNITENSISAQFKATAPPISLFNDYGSLELKIGAKGSEHTKSQSLKVTSYEDSGSYPIPSLDSFLGGYSNSSFFNNQYALNMMPNPSLLRSWLNARHYGNPGSFIYADSVNHQLEVDPQTFTAIDQTAAAFFQGKMKLDKLTLIGGLRCEFLSFHYSGIQDTSEGYSNSIIQRFPLDMYKSFFFPLPMLLGRFAFDKTLDARLSYTHTYSPPDWMDLVPTKVFTSDDGQEQVDMGNPDLKPTQSNNIDAGIEYYPNNLDMASFGVFYKNMNDYIFSTRGYYENAIYSPYIIAVSSGSHEPITAYSKANGNSADLAGFEATLMQRFLFLPGFLSGFGINANYTYTWSQALMPGFSQYTALPGQSEHVGNVALFYEKYGFSVRLALNVQSSYIFELDTYIDPAGAKLLLPNYTDTHSQLDCSVSQNLSRDVTVLAAVNNLTNAPARLYLGSPGYPTQIEYYSWAVHAGVKVDLNL